MPIISTIFNAFYNCSYCNEWFIVKKEKNGETHKIDVNTIEEHNFKHMDKDVFCLCPQCTKNPNMIKEISGILLKESFKEI